MWEGETTTETYTTYTLTQRYRRYNLKSKFNTDCVLVSAARRVSQYPAVNAA